jgi:LppX_LprAFG lipoprotein
MIRRLLFLATAAMLVLGACSSSNSASTAPVLTDPKDILTQSVATIKDIKSFHIHADVTGSVTIDLTGSGSGGAIDLKGTNADGDVDIANKKLHVAFGAPNLLSVTGDVIVIGDTTYTKVSLLSTKYSKSVSTNSSDPVSAATDPTQIIDQLNSFLNQPGVAPTKLADEACGDTTCYHVSLNLSGDQLSSITGAIGSAAPTAAGPSASASTGTVDVWVQKNDLRPAKLTVNASIGTIGTIAVTLTISKYDAPVTVTAPADSEIEPAAS